MSGLLNHQFRDDKGRTWTFSITIGTYRKIKEEEGIDITDVFSKNNWIQRVSSGEDISLIITLSILALQKSMEEQNVSIEEFCDSLGGDALEHMATALIGGVVNFMPEHKRKPLVKAVELLYKERSHASDVVTRQMTKIEPQLMQQRAEIEQHLETEMDSMLKEWKNSSSNPPE